MKIFIGADHRGYDLKDKFKVFLETLNYEVIDTSPGPLNPEDDYPIIASTLVKQMSAEESDKRGILICGSGQGMVIAANRFKGIRACLCWNENEAKSSRNDDDSNVLCLSTDQIKYEDATKIIVIWLNTAFSTEERFSRRVKELDELG